MEEKRNGKAMKIIISVMAAVIIILGGFLTYMLLGHKDDNNSSKAETTTVQETTEAPTTESTTAASTTTMHISPLESISFSMGSEKSDINEIMNYDSNKTYKASLSEFAEEGYTIDSFVFVFYSNDGKSNIRSYKGACGISVNDDCSAATDKGWYQSDDFEVKLNSAYAEIKWDVPGEIKDYVNIDKKGYIEIGYWWGGVKDLRLASIICNYTVSKEIPVDGTKTINPETVLNYGSESTKTTKIPLGDMLNKNDIPQLFIFDIEAAGELQKYSGAFGISVLDNCPAKTDKNWYQSGNAAVLTSSNTATLYWLVPDNIKEYITPDGDLMLGYWWSKQQDITLKNVTVKYSNNGSAVSTNDNTEQKTQIKKKDNNENNNKMSQITSEEVVKDMKIGWNLGNTLECYDITWQVNDYETAWGNPLTTKKMIDEIKSAGFNAVRIPVSWNDHMNGDTIDKAWLDRVNTVVDYVIDNDMYAILNVHHDDYTWLNPLYAKEAQVKARLIKIWKQLSDRFKSYDEKLLFEGMNEPRLIGSAAEWTGGTAEERDVINNLFQAFVDTVRASGGNNEFRHLIITTHAASITDDAVKALKVPNDDRIIVSIHYYSPWDFAGNESKVSSWGSDSEQKELDKGFDLLKNTFINKGVPVIIGEFGATNKNNTAVRAKYIEYYVKSAKSRGITCFIWDNGNKDEFGLFDRKNLTWYYESIMKSAVNAAK